MSLGKGNVHRCLVHFKGFFSSMVFFTTVKKYFKSYLIRTINYHFI